MQALVYYAYHGRYDDQACNDPSRVECPATFNAMIYALGEELQMPSIKKLAIDKFRTVYINNNCLPDFSDAVTVIYLSTPSRDRGLPDIIPKLDVKTVQKLNNHAGFQVATQEVPGFAADLLQSTLLAQGTASPGQAPAITIYKCPGCFAKLRFVPKPGDSLIHCYRCSRSAPANGWASCIVKE